MHHFSDISADCFLAGAFFKRHYDVPQDGMACIAIALAKVCCNRRDVSLLVHRIENTNVFLVFRDFGTRLRRSENSLLHVVHG